MGYIGRHTPKHEGKKGNPELRLRDGELFDPFRKTGRGEGTIKLAEDASTVSAHSLD